MAEEPGELSRLLSAHTTTNLTHRQEAQIIQGVAVPAAFKETSMRCVDSGREKGRTAIKELERSQWKKVL